MTYERQWGYLMKIDITEEEREFLERVCVRAEVFLSMGIFRDTPNGRLILDNDLHAIRALKLKFRQLDTNLIKKVIDED